MLALEQKISKTTKEIKMIKEIVVERSDKVLAPNGHHSTVTQSFTWGNLNKKGSARNRK